MLQLPDILGQPRAIQLLNSAMRADRVHHAWIFHGPQGVGKFTAALAFASALLDESTRETNNCFAPESDTPTQILIDAGTHPDLHIVTKELAKFSDNAQIRDRKQTTIPKEVVEEHLLAPAWKSAIRPSQSRARKVFIVDEVELLAPVTQNAILKTLEEPPPGTIIILVTSSKDRLLPTIRSRCQRVAFTPLNDDDMHQWLTHQRIDLPDDAELVLSFAAGSPGRILLAQETGMFEWGSALTPLLLDAERGVFRPQLGELLASLADEWAKRWVDAHENASKDAANIAAANRLLGMLTERARRGLRTATQQHLDPDPYLHTIDVLGQAQTQIASHVNLKFAMANAGAQLARRQGGVASPLLSLRR